MQRFALALVVALLASGPVVMNAQNPDVIVGDLIEINSYGSEGDIYAYSVGTESCNIGNVNLSWVASTPLHPVIGQEMWRLKDGVLEQIGISWLKHSFCALDLNLCDTCTITNDCDWLGVGCSDPYGAGLNGSQGNLGPRSQVNASNGVFPYPFTAPPFNGITARRLQVKAEDLVPAENVGAQYFVTSHYVTQDDAQGGNGENNSSYREVIVGDIPTNYPLSFAPGSTTQQMAPGIQAWQDYVPAVTLQDVNIPNDGLIIVGHNVTNNGNGTWHYEYAIYNLNSDRSIGEFSVDFPGSANITNISMNDVDYHSGEPYDLTDWPGTYTPGLGVSWATTPFSTNSDANAIRWSTMYNFRFDADVPPTSGSATLGVFKPGTPNAATINVDVPNGSTVPAITNFACVPNATQVDLSWTNGDIYDSIEVSRDGAVIATIGGTATSFADPGLPAGSYTWSLRAFQGPDATFPLDCDATITLRTLSIPDMTAFSGQSALQIPILATNSSPLDAFSASVQIPSDRLTVLQVSIDNTITETVGAEFVETNTGVGFATITVVLDAMGPFANQMIPAGTEQEIATMIAEVSPTVVDGETRSLNFVDGLGPSTTPNTVEIGGVTQTPLTENATVTFASAPTFIRGDCDSDNQVIIVDAIFALTYMFAGGAAPTCFSACDADDNGQVNIVDAIGILNYLFLAGSPPPAAPWPSAGSDPTPDSLPCL